MRAWLVSIMSDEHGQPAGLLLSRSAQHFTRAPVQEPELQKSWVSFPHISGHSQLVELRPVFNWYQTSLVQ